MKKKRTPWPRWAKILRNILLAALLGFLMWDVWDHPSFFYMADLRRVERQWLIPETECIAEISRGIWGVDARIGWTEGAAVASFPRRGKFFTNAAAMPYLLTEGPNLIALPWSTGLQDRYGQPHSYACYVALQLPEDSASAVLTLHNEDGTYTVSSQREGDIFLFYAAPEPDENYISRMGSSWFYMGQFTYELEFYDENGNMIQEVSG